MNAIVLVRVFNGVFNGVFNVSASMSIAENLWKKMKATSNTKLLKMDRKVHENFAGFGNPEQEVGALLNTGKPQDSSGREDEGASSAEGHAEESEDVVCFACPGCEAGHEAQHEAGCVKNMRASQTYRITLTPESTSISLRLR